MTGRSERGHGDCGCLALGSAEVGREVGQLQHSHELGLDGREVAVVADDAHLVLVEQGARPEGLAVDHEGPVLTEAVGHALVPGVGEAVAVDDRPSRVSDDEATELLELGMLERLAGRVPVGQVGRHWHRQVRLDVDDGLAVLAGPDRVELLLPRGPEVDQLEAGHDEGHVAQRSEFRGIAGELERPLPNGPIWPGLFDRQLDLALGDRRHFSLQSPNQHPILAERAPFGHEGRKWIGRISSTPLAVLETALSARLWAGFQVL